MGHTENLTIIEQLQWQLREADICLKVKDYELELQARLQHSSSDNLC